EISSATLWITLLKGLSRHYEAMKLCNRSLVLRAEWPFMTARTQPHWMTVWRCILTTHPVNQQTPTAGEIEEKGRGNKWVKVRQGLAQEGGAIAVLTSSVFTSWLTSARYQYMRWSSKPLISLQSRN